MWKTKAVAMNPLWGSGNEWPRGGFPRSGSIGLEGSGHGTLLLPTIFYRKQSIAETI